MHQHSDAIVNSLLFRQLDLSQGVEHLSESDITSLKGTVIDVANHIAPHLERIRETFHQYTEHDLRHICNVADLAYLILPKKSPANTDDDTCDERVRLNALEIAILWLAILLHDIGMFVGDEEKKELASSEEYKNFLRSNDDRVQLSHESRITGRHVNAQMIEDAIFAEFIRLRHASRVRKYIETELAKSTALCFRDYPLTDAVVTLCESHAWGVRESHDSRHADHTVSQLPLKKHISGIRVNLRYLGCILRLGDILDFDRSRTPPSVYRQIDFTESNSLKEWNKHLSISGWDITDRGVAFEAECTHPVYYVAIHEFLDAVDYELKECRYLLDEHSSKAAAKYTLNIAHSVDRRGIRMKNPRYLAGGFRFEFEYENIMQLLMDRSLYPSPTLFLRELLQNSLDACRLQQAIAATEGMREKYYPRIVIEDNSERSDDPTIVFTDNGVGMSRHIVENFFLRVGRSYYRSQEFRAEQHRLSEHGSTLETTSQFGIGFLACFLAADHIEIDTYRYGDAPLHVDITGSNKYFVIERRDQTSNEVRFRSPKHATEDGPFAYSGTRIVVHLRKGWLDTEEENNPNIVFETLNSFAVNQDMDITIIPNKGKPPQTIGCHKWHRGRLAIVAAQDARSDDLQACPEFLPALTASEIVLSDEDCCRGISGKVWIWLLKGAQGKPVPKQGMLVLNREGYGKSPWQATLNSRPLSLFDDAAGWLPEVGPSNLLTLLETHASNKDIDSKALTLELVDLLAPIAHDLHEHPGITADDFVESWASLSVRLRRLIISGLKKCTKQRYALNKNWHSVKGLPQLLLEDEPDAAFAFARRQGHRISFNEIWRITLPSRYELAYFGIRVPGGVLDWNAKTSTGNRWRIVPDTVTAHLDLVSSNNATLAANRLFLPLENAKYLATRVNRAILRRAHALFLQAPGDQYWKDWFRGMVRSVEMIAPDAIEEEKTLVKGILY